MTVGHVLFTDTAANAYGYHLRKALSALEDGRDDLTDILATMVQMIDGDSGNAANYTYMTERYGFTDNATAKACFDELNSALGKLNTDGSVSNVHAAMNQCFAKLR